jgi:hypothetical protein
MLNGQKGGDILRSKEIILGLLILSFVFSALILVGLDPGVYFLRETNIRVFITDDARGRCWK